MQSLADLADRTPPDRERHVDLVRAVSIAAVVLGHWIVIAVTDHDGLDGVNALRDVEWFRPLTWLFQVMPLFFLVGGYANAASLRSHRRRGGGDTAWVVRRFDRLVRPATVLLGVLVVGAVVARVAGVDPDDIGTAVWLATVPLWFLLAYLAVLALTPWMSWFHDRAGLVVVWLLAAWVVANDVARRAVELPYVGEANHLAVWLVVHQLGVAWQAGDLRATVPTGLTIAVPATLALVVLVGAGVYAVSMVAVPGQELQNTEPPTVALLLLGLVQVGVTLALRDRCTRWVERRRAWQAVVAVNAVILTLFLWHMSSALVTAVALHGTGLLPTAPVGSLDWLVLRLPWLAACAVVLAVLVGVFARVELASPAVRSGAAFGRGAAAATVVAVAALLGGLIGVAVAGPRDRLLGLPAWSVVAYAAGALVLWLVARSASADGELGGVSTTAVRRVRRD